MAGPLEAIIQAILGRRPNPGGSGSPYPTDYMDTAGRLKMMGGEIPGDLNDPMAAMRARVAASGAGPGPGAGPSVRADAYVPDTGMDRLMRSASAASQPGSTAGASNLDPMAQMNMSTYRSRPEGGPTEAVADTMEPDADVDDERISGDSTYDPSSDTFTQQPPLEAEVVDTDVGGKMHGSGGSDKEGTGGSTITVKKGDSLWRIATQVAGTKDPKAISAMVKQLAQANGIANPDQISVGMKLKVPEANVPLPRMRPTASAEEE